MSTIEPPQPGTEPLLVSIGDIGVSASWVNTPSGSKPVGQVQWMFTDMSRTTEKIPTWAIICTSGAHLKAACAR